MPSSTRANARLLRQVVRLKQAHRQARDLAGHDKLTGLPNRHLLSDRLDQALVRTRRSGKHVALLMLDLNEFKNVNDQLGHSAGDELLRQVAMRLSSCVRASDTVCRYGGDEFVILVTDVVAAKLGQFVDRVAEAIKDCLTAPYSIDGSIVNMTLSMGRALLNHPGYSGAELICVADAAMYREKRMLKSSGG